MFMRFLGIGIGHCNQHFNEAETVDGNDAQTCLDDESYGEGAGHDMDTEEEEEDGTGYAESDNDNDLSDDLGYDDL